MHYIYKITNIQNNKCYVGQTKDYRHRIYLHKWSLNNNRHGNSHLQAAWNKSGKDSFTFEIIQEIQLIQNVDDLERFWISFYKCIQRKFGYNFESGGHANKVVSIETREKLRIANLGKKLTEETKAKLSRPGKSNHFFGKKHTKESLSKMLENRPVREKPTKSYIRSDECRAKQSAAAFARVYTEEQLERTRINGAKMGKAVRCIELNLVFSSQSEAAKQLNITRTHISAAVLGKKRTAGGYTWEQV